MTVLIINKQANVPLKKTELGFIPEDWDTRTLGDLCEFENGDRSSNYPSGKDFSSSGIPFINAGHVSGGRIEFNRMDFITHESYCRLTRGKVRVGDILYCLRGSLGKYGLVPQGFGQGAIASSLVIVRPKPTRLSRKYLTCYFGSGLCSQMIENWASGAAQPNLGVQDLARFLAPIPSSVGEQEAIGEALHDADTLITSLEQLLTKKRQIKQSIMQELLTGKRRLPGFSGDWDEVPLGTLLHSRPDYGINAPAVRYTPSLPTYLRITDIDDEGRFLASSAVSVDRPDVELYYLNPGDVVFARTGASVGKSYLHKDSVGPLVFAGFLIRVQPIVAKLVPAYLFYFSQTRRYWKWVTLMSMRSGQPGLNGQELATMPIPLPQIDEQHAIASVLEDIDAEIDALEARLTKNRDLKQAMAQALLTGHIRLMEPNA